MSASSEHNTAESSLVGISRDRVTYAAADASGAHDLPPLEHRGDWSPRRAVLYPNVYVWFVFLAALDIVFTWMILHREGSELNWLASLVIEHGGVYGVAAYKFGLAVVVITVCEIVGRRRYSIGRRLAKAAVVLTAVPVVVGITQLLADTFRQPPPL